MITTKTCRICGKVKSVEMFGKNIRKPDGRKTECKECHNKASRDSRYRRGVSAPFQENKKCPAFLGVHVAERVLASVFDNVVRMDFNNTGYDFICGKGYKIDVKSSTRTTNQPNTWVFGINRNKVADYFLILAFDNRDDLNPLHVWLIPSGVLNHLTCTSISDSTLKKWSGWEKPIGKVIACCSKIRHEPIKEARAGGA